MPPLLLILFYEELRRLDDCDESGPAQRSVSWRPREGSGLAMSAQEGGGSLTVKQHSEMASRCAAVLICMSRLAEVRFRSDWFKNHRRLTEVRRATWGGRPWPQESGKGPLF